jgi:hypothetical protein
MKKTTAAELQALLKETNHELMNYNNTIVLTYKGITVRDEGCLEEYAYYLRNIDRYADDCTIAWIYAI